MSKILAGEPIEIWGDGSVVRDFIYVTDLAELCVLAVQSKKSGIYNAGSGVGHSINEVVSIFREVTGQAIEPVYRPGRGYDVPSVVLDIMGAKNTFEWSPQIDLRDGIERSWQWANSQA
jgi:UDP-glucose 4-epimerase